MLHFLGTELDLEVDEVWECYAGRGCSPDMKCRARHGWSQRFTRRHPAPNGYVPLSRLGRWSVSASGRQRWATPCDIRPTARWSWSPWRPPPWSPTGCCCALTFTTAYSLRPDGVCRLIASNLTSAQSPPPHRSSPSPHLRVRQAQARQANRSKPYTRRWINFPSQDWSRIGADNR